MFRIKICGITTPEDAALAAAAGADGVGINFYAGSKRFVAPDKAKEIARAVPAGVAKVGVFVNSPVEKIQKLADEVPLDFVQLHGDEPAEMVGDLAPLEVIKAIRVEGTSLAPVEEFLTACGFAPNLRGILLDAYSPSEYGGTGESLDWQALGQRKNQFGGLPLILAGGLTPENVASAIRQAQPDGVDVGSGVESSPGVKDAAQVQAFIEAAADALDEPKA